MAGFDLKSFFGKPKRIRQRGRAVLYRTQLDSSLLDDMPGALIAYDSDFKVLRFNTAAERLFNLPAASVVGRVLSPRDASDPTRQILAQTIFSSLAPRIVKISRKGNGRRYTIFHSRIQGWSSG